jgi:hypothetical protein
MNRDLGKTSFLFLFLIATAMVLKPVLVFAGVESLVHPILVSPKAMSSTLGVPARASAASYRMDKMEKDPTGDALLKVEIPKTGFSRGLGDSFNGKPGIEISRLPRSPVLRI